MRAVTSTPLALQLTEASEPLPPVWNGHNFDSITVKALPDSALKGSRITVNTLVALLRSWVRQQLMRVGVQGVFLWAIGRFVPLRSTRW